MRNLALPGPDGSSLRLTSVAEVREDRGPAEIHRLQQQRAAVVSANVEGRSLGAAVADVRAALADLSPPPGLTVELGGQNSEMQVSFGSLRFAILLAVFLVYLVMAATFESFLHPLLVLFTIPLALIGVVAALLLTGTPVTVIVLIGVVMLVGIVVNNAIVLVDAINRLRRAGVPKQEAIVARRAPAPAPDPDDDPDDRPRPAAHGPGLGRGGRAALAAGDHRGERTAAEHPVDADRDSGRLPRRAVAHRRRALATREGGTDGMTLPEIAIKRPVSVLMLLASIVLLGVVALTRLPLAFMPDIQEPELFVQLPYQNASPEQVERMVVRPVEDALGSVKGLQSLWSSCDGEGGRIRLGFDWGADLHLARTEVWERIDRIRGDLPEDLGDIQVSSNWDSRESESPILEGRLSSPRDLSESYDLLERKIIRPLERVPGVAQVRLDGVNPREVRINLRLADLEPHGMDVRDVSRRLRTGNFDQSLGQVVEGDARWTLRTVGTLSTVEQIRALPLRADGLRLSDVADVVYQEPPLEYGRHLDGDFAIGVSVSQESRANTVEVCDALDGRHRAHEGRPRAAGRQLPGLVQPGRRRSARRCATSRSPAIFGAILAAVVLFVFLRRVSTTVIAVLCIPFSLIVTCGIIWAQGKSLNTLTLLGLIVGVGMLVDNAVVVMENIFRHREEGADRATASRVGAARGRHRGHRRHAHLGDRLHPADLQQAQRDEHLPQGAGDHGLPGPAGLAVHQPDPDPAGDRLVHRLRSRAPAAAG